LQTRPIRIGTRGSRLALIQANEARDRLIAAHGLAPDEVEIVTITTTGDRIRDRPLADIGGKALFAKEIEEALRDGDIDLAVHSMKDMPGDATPGLMIPAFLPREDPRDAFMSRVAADVMALPQGARLGSSSVRRIAQLKHIRPDLVAAPFRGNVETRLAKLDRGEVDATVLACAGLRRLGLDHEITVAMAPEVMLPAVAQGAIGLAGARERRADARDDRAAQRCSDGPPDGGRAGVPDRARGLLPDAARRPCGAGRRPDCISRHGAGAGRLGGFRGAARRGGR
jgi:hydroxymethylbilane synthase